MTCGCVIKMFPGPHAKSERTLPDQLNAVGFISSLRLHLRLHTAGELHKIIEDRKFLVSFITTGMVRI